MRRIAVISIALILCALPLVPHIWRYYIAPRDALSQAVNQCAAEADKVFGIKIVEWLEQNKTDAFNPYRKARDEFIEVCVKKDGWCSIGDDSIWPASRPWAFAPRDPLAMRLYDFRYKANATASCTD